MRSRSILRKAAEDRPERDPPVVTDVPLPVCSVTNMPPQVVSVADVPKPPVVSAADESAKVVIVGTNGVIARFGRAGAPPPPNTQEAREKAARKP